MQFFLRKKRKKKRKRVLFQNIFSFPDRYKGFRLYNNFYKDSLDEKKDSFWVILAYSLNLYLPSFGSRFFFLYALSYSRWAATLYYKRKRESFKNQIIGRLFTYARTDSFRTLLRRSWNFLLPLFFSVNALPTPILIESERACSTEPFKGSVFMALFDRFLLSFSDITDSIFLSSC